MIMWVAENVYVSDSKNIVAIRQAQTTDGTIVTIVVQKDPQATDTSSFPVRLAHAGADGVTGN